MGTSALYIIVLSRLPSGSDIPVLYINSILKLLHRKNTLKPKSIIISLQLIR